MESVEPISLDKMSVSFDCMQMAMGIMLLECSWI